MCVPFVDDKSSTKCSSPSSATSIHLNEHLDNSCRLLGSPINAWKAETPGTWSRTSTSPAEPIKLIPVLMGYRIWVPWTSFWVTSCATYVLVIRYCNYLNAQHTVLFWDPEMSRVRSFWMYLSFRLSEEYEASITSRLFVAIGFDTWLGNPWNSSKYI